MMWGRMRKARAFLEQAETRHAVVRDRDGRSVASDAVIAAVDPDSGKIWDNIGPIVSVALLLELAHEHRLEVTGEGKKARVTVRDSNPIGDAALDEALLTIGSGVFGQRASTLLQFLPTSEDVVTQLVAAGLVVRETPPGSGMFASRRYRTTTVAVRDDVVVRVRGALLGQLAPDAHTTMLVAALDLAMPMKLFVPKDRRKEADRSAKDLRDRLTADQRVLFSAVQEAMRSSGGYSSNI